MSRDKDNWQRLQNFEEDTGLPQEIYEEIGVSVYNTTSGGWAMPKKQRKATFAPKKPLTKAQRGWAITGIVFLCLFVFIGSLLLWFFWDVIFDKSQNSDLGEYYGLFGYAPLTQENSIYTDYTEMLAAQSEKLNLALSDDSTPQDKALAAYILYRTACLANETAPMTAKYTVGGGSATGDLKVNDALMSVGAQMNLTSTYYNIAYPYTTRPADLADAKSRVKYSANEEYTQIPAGAVTASDKGIQSVGQVVLGAMLPFARRSINTPTSRIVWHGDQKSSVITPDGVTATFDNAAELSIIDGEKLNEERAKERQYSDDWYDEYGLSAHDLSVHLINLNTIIADSVTISKKTGSDVNNEDMDYYEVSFEIDTVTGRGTEDSATYFAEQLYLSQAPEAFMSMLSDYKLYYSKLLVNMTVFTNGYLRTWGTDETWLMSGGVELGFVTASAVVTTNNFSNEAYCYDYDTIMQGFVNRWFGDDARAGVPLTSLPFAEDTNGVTRQPYGSYR